ncbi:MAG: cell division protein FtsQ/DivIB [Candidatus Omnitrophica bacterium]|nr:cell division protein FtsQ/DivIB [Candidatus Omnitrophota bacterium]MDD5574174.1 cell division protein FtsQ/DivIB [Candidatus Omnitrophota bacterium]
MAKKKKNNNNPWPFFLLVILPLAAIILSSLAIVRGIQNYVTTSHYFKVRELRAEGISDQRYLEMIKNDVVGANIFRLDAGALAERTRRRFPHFYSVVVRRVLPSQLLIVAKERRPVVWLKRDVYYMMDASGVVVGTAPLSETPALPLLTGMDAKFPKFKVGVSYASSILHKSLLLGKILKVRDAEIRQALAGTSLTVTRIDASNPEELSFYLGAELEVKAGDRNFDARIALLPAILRTVSGDISRITYIDLRPKEPVVATKDIPQR